MSIADRKNIPAILIFDGEAFFLFVAEETTIQDFKSRTEEYLVKDLRTKIVFPNYINLKSGQLSQVIKVWK
jgi:hypothetical protein